MPTAVTHFLRCVALALTVSVLAGSTTALFLWSLDLVTRLHWHHPWLLWLLPIGGCGVGLLYHYVGAGSEKGNNLLIDEIHTPSGRVPTRMAPLVLFGTLVTHLFGGSAGREGTAVQMGGSLADMLARAFLVSRDQRRLLLMCGIAAGFGAVFGTPFTGALFAMEVIVIGKLQYEALIPVLLSSIVGDATCSAWGIEHTSYHLEVPTNAGSYAPFETLMICKVMMAGVAFGWVSRMFSESTHAMQRRMAKLVPYAPQRPALGGLAVIALTLVMGTRDYLGLGVDVSPSGEVSIISSFAEGGVTALSWLWKTIFTVLTLSSGFKGGELTPLFFIGSTLGNTLGGLMNEPRAFFAALGFIAVFAGAANTPLASMVMGIELFGAHYILYFALACFVSYFSSGHTGIYLSQRIGVSKRGSTEQLRGRSLSEVRNQSARLHDPHSST
jgi:H+/Cl- antiporter ClcA